LTPESPNPLEAAHLLRDLYEARQEMQELRTRLQHAQRLAALGTLAASIAHEVNNLLTPVLSYARFAQARPDDHALTAKALERAASGAEQASQIASAILRLAGNRTGNSPTARSSGLAFEQTNVASAIRDAMLCLARDPARDGITVVLDVDPSAEVAMEPVALQQVLLNLVLNALHAMTQGGRLAISAAVAPAAGPVVHQARTQGRSTWNVREGIAGHVARSALPHAQNTRGVMITVEDSGRGIDAAVLPKIFEPFAVGADVPQDGAGNRLGDARSPRAGTGLGLSICKQLVTAARGSIQVRSEVGKGTRFSIHLPEASPARLKASA
jgi:signal transduction histidine kinase